MRATFSNLFFKCTLSQPISMIFSMLFCRKHPKATRSQASFHPGRKVKAASRAACQAHRWLKKTPFSPPQTAALSSMA